VTGLHTLPMRVRIRAVPPSRTLEGFDLSPYHFEAGHIYDLPTRLAEVLVLWGYAEPERRGEPRAEAADKKRRK
jgi:hypothetical protein